jgi:hypothetical protein
MNNIDVIPNFTRNPLPKITREEKNEMKYLVRRFFKEGGKIKDYGTNFELNDYKLKKDK